MDMNKRIIALLMAAVMVLMMFSGCAKGGAAGNEGSESETSGNETKEETSAEEDGQNPVMNYVGKYGCGRATAEVTAEGTDGAKVVITWAGSAFENSEWVMTGTFDSDKQLFSYTDCVKTDYVYKDEGVVESKTVVYTDGQGTMQFTDDLTFTWQDDKENAGEDMVFKYAS